MLYSVSTLTTSSFFKAWQLFGLFQHPTLTFLHRQVSLSHFLNHVFTQCIFYSYLIIQLLYLLLTITSECNQYIIHSCSCACWCNCQLDHKKNIRILHQNPDEQIVQHCSLHWCQIGRLNKCCTHFSPFFLSICTLSCPGSTFCSRLICTEAAKMSDKCTAPANTRTTS